ncbi:hypothetical protein V1524DRAFT_430956 [Lipomyces starkeyi]
MRAANEYSARALAMCGLVQAWIWLPLLSAGDYAVSGCRTEMYARGRCTAGLSAVGAPRTYGDCHGLSYTSAIYTFGTPYPNLLASFAPRYASFPLSIRLASG